MHPRLYVTLLQVISLSYVIVNYMRLHVGSLTLYAVLCVCMLCRVLISNLKLLVHFPFTFCMIFSMNLQRYAASDTSGKVLRTISK